MAYVVPLHDVLLGLKMWNSNDNGHPMAAATMRDIAAAWLPLMTSLSPPDSFLGSWDATAQFDCCDRRRRLLQVPTQDETPAKTPQP